MGDGEAFENHELGNIDGIWGIFNHEGHEEHEGGVGWGILPMELTNGTNLWSVSYTHLTLPTKA